MKSTEAARRAKIDSANPPADRSKTYREGGTQVIDYVSPDEALHRAPTEPQRNREVGPDGKRDCDR